jgi:hypothetical protein
MLALSLVTAICQVATAVSQPKTAPELVQLMHSRLREANDAFYIGGDNDARAKAQAKADAALTSTCEGYLVLEIHFGLRARDVKGWPEVCKLAAQLYTHLEKRPALAFFSQNLPHLKAWTLIFSGDYDAALQSLEKQPKSSGSSLPGFDVFVTRRNALIEQARIFAYAGKNDYASAASAALSSVAPGTDRGDFYLIAAFMLAKAGRLEEARAQCRIITDIFPGTSVEEDAQKIASDYQLALPQPDIVYITKNYIESSKPALRSEGIAALGAHKFPGAFALLSAYYDNSTSEIDKKSALRGMAAAGDVKSIAFLLQVALSDEDNSDRSVFHSFDTLPRHAIGMLCAHNHEQAVLEYMRQAQGSVRLRTNLASMNYGLKRVFGGAPEPEDPGDPQNIPASRWIKWLRETGRLQPLPVPEPPPVLPFPVADERRVTNAWFFMQLEAFEKNTESLSKLKDACDQFEKTMDAMEDFGSDGASRVFLTVATVNAVCEIHIAARRAPAVKQLSVPEWFPEKEKSFYGSMLMQLTPFSDGIAECARVLDDIENHKYEKAVTHEKWEYIRAKTKELVALRQIIFTKSEKKERLRIMLNDGEELLRSAGMEKYIKNTQRMENILSRLSGMLSPENPTRQNYITQTHTRARAMAARQEFDANSLESSEIANEYRAYYEACRQILDDMEPLIKNKTGAKTDKDVSRRLFGQVYALEERRQSLAKLAIAAKRQEHGTALIAPVSNYGYDHIKRIKQQAEIIRKEFEKYKEYLEAGESLPLLMEGFLNDASTWVAAKKSSGKYDSWKFTNAAINSPLPLDTQAIRPYMDAAGVEAVETLRTKWEQVRNPLIHQLATLKNILDTENYTNDNGEAYEKVRGELMALAKAGSNMFMPALGDVNAQLVNSLIKIAATNTPDKRLPAPPLVDVNAAMLALTTFTTSPTDPTDPEARARAWRENLTECLMKLQYALAKSESIQTHDWLAAWRESKNQWQLALRDAIRDVAQVLQPQKVHFAKRITNTSLLSMDAEVLKTDSTAFMNLLNLTAVVPYEDVYLEDSWE